MGSPLFVVRKLWTIKPLSSEQVILFLEDCGAEGGSICEERKNRKMKLKGIWGAIVVLK